QAGNVTGGVVLGSRATRPAAIQAARFGSSPAAAIGPTTSRLAPSSARTRTGRRAAVRWAVDGADAVDAGGPMLVVQMADHGVGQLLRRRLAAEIARMVAR